jgi:hypothetical protein
MLGMPAKINLQNSELQGDDQDPIVELIFWGKILMIDGEDYEEMDCEDIA